MTDDAAQPHRPGPTEKTPGQGASEAPDAVQDAPGTPPPATGATAWDATAPPVGTPPPAGPGGSGGSAYSGGPSAAPPPGGTGAAPPPPPPDGTWPHFGGAGFTSRYGLVRPRDGRYLAGVCAAVGRATNTDPVLWRVLLAVLGFFGGIGILLYVAAWLIIPGEGDTASPVESMLGRGRSSMSPVTVIVLSILVAISFGFIVTDAFRAVLLGAAILVGGALLLNRHQQRGPQPAGGSAGAPAGPARPPGPVPPVGYPGPAGYPPPSGGFGRTAPAFAAPAAFHAPAPAPWAAPAPAGQTAQPTRHLPPTPPWPSMGAPTSPLVSPTAPPQSPAYRAPFAPHGPYAGQSPVAPPPPMPKPPKKPRERSALGAVTFSLIFVALGVVGVLDLLDVFSVGASAYFAAVLAVIALGLLVGTWFGRARWLIALGLVASAALAVATVAESYDRVRGVDGTVTWAPADHRDLAVRYEQSFADAVLDLRAVDFDQKDTEITVVINFGEATVVLPPNVDVTANAQVTAGDAKVFGQRAGGLDNRLTEIVDLGADGAGGGKLRLNLHVNAGHMEVTR
ncbi:PspC domain-containing protein [Micromonospora craniellae]|uniref:PspC domain-containing protein n=1 Tax=Micromonospora craniellae TaxID=2294034 RepID=A0A372G630_9ACTN|nr:PspC domain-containing protein [Micromonospora craniellae]QOC90385.1 PspC domain-containing protein [Micromonospora craniellae]RFS48226.1 PspC domain-containing protein [Micromonospora craniellae]